MLAAMRLPAAPAVVLLLALAGCASGTSSPSAVTSSGPSRPASAPPPTTQLTIPAPALAVDPCKLTDAQVSAVVGFAVVKKKTNISGQCEYLHDPGGSVWFSVDAASTEDLGRGKSEETFSLGGRYVTITDEQGFAHDTFTAVKNPGDKSPGVIADLWAWLAPGHLKLRIYYPGGGKPPGRQHALRLAHLMLG
jgi:hypothetical protein